MNYCVVPNNDLDHNISAPPTLPPNAPPNSSNPSLDCEVTELKWKNGQLAMHGLGRGANKSATCPPWDESLAAAAGTLESIVSSATTCRAPRGSGGNEMQVPWFDQNHSITTATTATTNLVVAASQGVTMTPDALVPCQMNMDLMNYNNKGIEEKPVTCMVGSCSVTAVVAEVKDVGSGAEHGGMCGCGTNVSMSESAACCGGGGGMDSRQMTVDGFTSTSLWSPENTSSGGGDYTKTSVDDLDHSVSHSRSQMENGDREGKRRLGVAKSSISTKTSRAAAIHKQSERKRRDRINERMKTLQKLVPNCSKTDKASMLDEVIEYLRQLQTQVAMMSSVNIPPMMLPFAFQQQQLQMSMMAGMGVMDINSIGRPAAAAMPPPSTAVPPQPPTPFVPMPSWDAPATDRLSSRMIAPNDMLFAFLNRQSQQPMTMEAYARLAAFCQQFQQSPGSTSKN